MFFAFRLGPARLCSGILSILIMCLMSLGLLLIPGFVPSPYPILIGVGAAAIILPGLLYLRDRLRPPGAVLTPEALLILIVRRTRPAVVLSAQQIVSLERIDRSVLRGLWRTYGGRGPTGYWGYFHCRKLGYFRAYITNMKSLVLIRTVSEGLFVLSPDSPEEFIARATEAFKLPSSNTCPSA